LLKLGLLYLVTYKRQYLLKIGANQYKWVQIGSNTTLISKDVNSASFDSVHEIVDIAIK
jgi:hypothetical protein